MWEEYNAVHLIPSIHNPAGPNDFYYCDYEVMQWAKNSWVECGICGQRTWRAVFVDHLERYHTGFLNYQSVPSKLAQIARDMDCSASRKVTKDRKMTEKEHEVYAIAHGLVYDKSRASNKNHMYGAWFHVEL
jgi:hypothetical protein